MGRLRLVIIPRDHHPPHLHTRNGTGRAPEVVIDLNFDGNLTLRGARRNLSQAEIRQLIEIVAAHFAELIELWERYC